MIKGTSKVKITIDMSQWEVGPWADSLNAATNVEVQKMGGGVFELAISPALDFDVIVRKIVTESVEEFFNSDNLYMMMAGAKGITLEGSSRTGLSHDILVPWNQILFSSKGDARKAIAKWIAEAEDEGQFGP